MKRFLIASVTTTLAAFAGSAAAAPPKTGGPALAVDVMTQNQYLGADIAPLIGAIGTPAFEGELIAALEQIADNRTTDRVARLAGQISSRKPHLVGLQEVWQFRCIPAVPQLGGYPCNAPAIAGAFQDHLTLTSTALGSAYSVAAIVQNFTVDTYTADDGTVYPGIPFFYEGVPAFLQVMDRDVILARSDVQTTKFKGYPCSKPSVDGCNYAVDLPLGPLGSVRRGFVIADTTIGGVDYRFVNTHLEVEGGGLIPGEVQAAQAAQLAQTVLATTPQERRLIIVGDMNSSPNDPPSSLPTPYQIFAASNLYDAWLLRPGNVAGLTCCQLEDLSNRVSILSRRIDLVLTREMPPKVKDVRVIGEVAADRLAPPGRGLWPSDHASVAAGLQY